LRHATPTLAPTLKGAPVRRYPESCPKKKLLFRLGCHGRDLHFESEVFQAADEP